MPQLTIEVSDAELRRLEKRARGSGYSAAGLAGFLLANELSVAAFPEGHIRDGCERLQSIVMAIPRASNWQWGSIEKRHWWVSFRLAPDADVYLKVIKTLAAYLNTDVLQSWGTKPFVFTPEYGHDGELDVEWRLETLVPMIEPIEVAEYLESRLPTTYDDEAAWRSFTPHI